MRILSHYFIARFFGLFLLVLVAALAILATVELVLNLDELALARPQEARAGFVGDVARVLGALWLRLSATYLADLPAIASFIASFLTFALAGRRLEPIAIQAGGVRLARVILPVLMAAGLISGLDAVVQESLVLRAARMRLAENRAERSTFDREQRAFWYHSGPIITNIGYADPTTRTLHDVELFERGLGGESGRIVRIVRAPIVRILENGVWRFDRASVWQFDAADPLAEPRFEPAAPLEIDLAAVPQDTLARADPAILPIAGLARHLARTGTPPLQRDPRLEAIFHERLSRPWRALVLCWLAVPFGLRVDRRGRIAPVAAAALLALTAYFALSNGGLALTRLGLLPAGLTAWTVPLLLSLGAALALPRRPG
ncbi:MAG: LptF/LptG family permease [Myxococcota bacterium]